MLLAVCKRSGPHLFSSSLRTTEVLAVASATAGWTQWRSITRTRYQVWMNVSICCAKRLCIWHWALTADIGKPKLPKNIGQSRLYIQSRSSSFTCLPLKLNNAPRTFQRAMQWTSKWRKSREICPCLLLRYCHMFSFARRTHGSGWRSIDDSTRRWSRPVFEEMLTLYESNWFYGSFHSPWGTSDC